MLLKAIITEKSMREAQNKRYTFAVTPAATKLGIKRAVEEMFGVKVLKVHTLRLDNAKKAIVQIDPKQSIDLWKKD